MSVKVPTLSTMGWIDTPHEKAAYMIACFIAANYSQSTAMYGKITTLQYLVKRYANQLPELERQLRQVFEDKVSAYFPESAHSDVNVLQADPDNPAIFTIALNCEIMQNGRYYQIGKLLHYNETIMTKITDIANG